MMVSADGESSRSDEEIQALIEERTQHCINLINDPKFDNSSKDVIILMGRPGTGKSSFVELFSGARGHAKGGIATVTKKIRIEHVDVEDHRIFVMDTPGFSSGGEAETLNEIKRGIALLRNNARFVGVLYFSKISERIEVLDEKLRAAVLGFCGPRFIPQITFVTTFWTSVCEEHDEELNKNLKQLKQGLLTEFAEKGAHFYEHGRGFPNVDGTGEFFNWYKPDGKLKISANAKKMILCKYKTILNVPKLRFVQELENGTSALKTEAASALGLDSDPLQGNKEPTPVSGPDTLSSQTGSLPPHPDPVGGTYCSSSQNQSWTSSRSQEPEEVKEECNDEREDENKDEPKNESKDGSKNETNKESKTENRHANARDNGSEKNHVPDWWQGPLNTIVDMAAKIVVHVITNNTGDIPRRSFANPPLSSNAGFSPSGFTRDSVSAMDHDKFWGGDGTKQSREQTAKKWNFNHPGSAGDTTWNIAFCNESRRRFSSQ